MSKRNLLPISFALIVAVFLIAAKPVKAQVDFTWTDNCLNSPTLFTPAGVSIPSIAAWQWDFGDGGTSTVPNALHSYYAPGNYFVTLTVVDTFSVTSSVSHPVYIVLPPVAHFTIPANNCKNTPVYFDDQASTSIGYIVRWTWDFGDGNVHIVNFPANPDVDHTYAVAGTFNATLTVKSSDSCENTEMKVIDIHSTPTSFFSYTTPSCNNAPVHFVALATNPAGQGYLQQWIWNFGDGSPAITIDFPSTPNILHQFATPGTYNVTLTVTNSVSCSNSFSTPVTVSPTPVANFFHTGTQCEDLTTTFTDASFANGAGNIVNWSWDFGDAASGVANTSNLQNPTHQYLNPGVYAVREIITSFNSCKDTIIKTLTIYPHPPVDFTHTGGSVNIPVYFSPDPLVTDLNSVATYYWEFGDGATAGSQNAVHTYISTGNYTSTLTITDTLGCINSISHVINVVNASVAHFSTSVPACNGNAVAFMDLSSVTSGYITSWHWDFGDGSDSTIVFPFNPNISHTYFVYGTYTVTLTIVTSDGSTATESQNITIYPKPIANFTNAQACFGQPTQFTDLSQAGTGTITQWLWTFGDPTSGVMNSSTVQNPQHIYFAAGTYSVQLIATSSLGCTDTIVKTVLIHALPPVDFSVSNNCINATVTFSPNSTVMNFASIANWLWNFGDGATSTLQNPTHIYPIAGTYTVTLSITDTNDCSNSLSKLLSIYAIPMAAFSFSQPACNQSEVAFTDLSQNNGGGAIVSWQWAFGDPASGADNTSSLQNPVHIFNSPGTYSVTLTISNANSCYSSVMASVEVHQIPTAAFTFTPPQLNEPVQFTDQSVAGSAILTSWNWDFGDGNSSALQNPTHSYSMPGNYTVFLTVTTNEGCINQVDSLLVVPPGASSITLNGRVFAGSQTINTAVVRLIKVDNTGLPVSVVKTSPGTNSYFVFENVPEGSYYLQAYPLIGGPTATIFLPTFYINSVYWQSAAIINLGQAQNPYDIHLAAYDIVNGGTLTINGQLINPGKSINTAEQEVLLLDNQNNPIRWTFTDMAGNFSFDSLPAGNYAVTPVINGLTSYPFYVTLNESTSPAFVKMIISGQIITSSKKTENKKQEYRIYPNPADDVLNVEINGLSETYKSEIVSTSGKILKSVQLNSGYNTLYINTLPPGLYLIKITDAKGVEYIQRFIRQ